MADVVVTIENMLKALIEGKKYRTLKDVLVTMNPADIALVLEDLRNGDLQLGRGNIHGGVAGIVRISDTGEHISDRISDLHLVTSCLDLQPLRLL